MFKVRKLLILVLFLFISIGCVGMHSEILPMGANEKSKK